MSPRFALAFVVGSLLLFLVGGIALSAASWDVQTRTHSLIFGFIALVGAVVFLVVARPHLPKSSRVAPLQAIVLLSVGLLVAVIFQLPGTWYSYSALGLLVVLVAAVHLAERLRKRKA